MEKGLYYIFTRPPLFVRLSEPEYSALASARAGILELVSVEEKFDILRENYREFELTLAESSIDTLLRDTDYDTFQEIRTQLARRIANLLSAARLYLDQMCHHFGGSRHPDLDLDVNALRREQYDRCLAFRAMEALRDYTQHRGMPIHKVTLKSKWEGEADAEHKLRFGVDFDLNLDELRDDGFKKAKVLSEIESAGADFKLKLAIRQYVSCLWEIHLALRSALNTSEQRWAKSLKQAIASVQALSSQETIHAVEMGVREDGFFKDEFYISESPIAYLERLKRKNRSLQKLERRFFSS